MSEGWVVPRGVSEVDPLTDIEIHEAINTLVCEGLAERRLIDGVIHIKLTPAGFERAARLVVELGSTP